MPDPLDHKSRVYPGARAALSEIEELCARLDQKHPLERKARFLLDIRGYLKLNGLHGSYVEFGCYRGGMMCAAHHVLEPTGQISIYAGLDTFTGEPEPTENEALLVPTLHAGEFACDRADVEAFLEQAMPGRWKLVQGDFRDEQVLRQIEPLAPFCVAVIDCNLLSAISRAAASSLRHARPGAVLFVDDYLSNFGDGQPHVARQVAAAAAAAGRELLPHHFYPPFARSFIIV